MRVIAVVQARMTSTRLPGKVLRPLGGRPLLGWVLRALARSEQIDEVCVATTDRASDDELADYAGSLGVRVVRGPEDDVLTRFVLAMDESETAAGHPAPAAGKPAPDAVVRITADCPLLDPGLVDLVVAAWRQDPSWDYVATTLVRTWPRGLDVELVTVSALRWLDARARGHHREHVTSLLLDGAGGHRLLGLVTAPSTADLRVTLDTEQDWSLLTGVVAALGDRVFSWSELVGFLRAHDEIAGRNAGVVQKPLGAG